MSDEIEAILDGITTAGRKQISEIRNTAKKQKSDIYARAESEANAQKARILSDGQTRLNRTRAVIEQQQVMKSLQLHADARQRLISKVLEQTQEKLSGVRSQASYKNILHTLISNAINALKLSLLHDQKIVLRFDKQDKTLVESIASSDLFSDVTIRFNIICRGGCIAESEDGLVQTYNTFDSRFQRALPLIQQNLSKYFEEIISSY